MANSESKLMMGLPGGVNSFSIVQSDTAAHECNRQQTDRQMISEPKWRVIRRLRVTWQVVHTHAPLFNK